MEAAGAGVGVALLSEESAALSGEQEVAKKRSTGGGEPAGRTKAPVVCQLVN